LIGYTTTRDAIRLGIEAHTVSRWRGRFVRDRLEGLTDEPRPGGPRKITDDQVEEVVVKTLESTPKDATHWTLAAVLSAHRGGPLPPEDQKIETDDSRAPG
jgi:transposase